MKHRVSGLRAAFGATCVAVLVAGCSSVTQGRAVSPLYNPFKAGGLPATDGPSGIRKGAPAPEGEVRNGDQGAADRLAVLSLNDIAQFWAGHYGES